MRVRWTGFEGEVVGLRPGSPWGVEVHVTNKGDFTAFYKEKDCEVMSAE